MLTVTCPGCGLSGEFPDEVRGRYAVCPRCHRNVHLIGPEPREDIVAAPVVVPAPTDAVSEAETAAGLELAVWVGNGAGQPGGYTLGPEVPEEAPGYLDWVRQEAVRFNEHVKRQFAFFQRRRAELTAQENRAEAACVAREQDLNRQRAALAGRAEAFKKREEAMARREEEVGKDIAEKLAALEQRQRELERAEESIERRLLELEELEDQFRRELARHERAMEVQKRLAQQRQEPEPAATPAPVVQQPLSAHPVPVPTDLPPGAKLQRWLQTLRAQRAVRGGSISTGG